MSFEDAAVFLGVAAGLVVLAFGLSWLLQDVPLRTRQANPGAVPERA